MPSGRRVKLIRRQPAPAPARLAVPLTARRGLACLAFPVGDIDPVVAAPAAADARSLSDPLVARTRGRRIGVRVDPEGDALEPVDERGGESEPGRTEA